MTDEQFAELVELKHELSVVEFKPPGLRTNESLFYLVVRAAMGMANHRDGGRIVIGIRETEGVFDPVGMTADEVESWRRHDHLADAMAPLAEPPVVFDVQVRQYKERDFVLVEVQEFADVPIICRFNFPNRRQPNQREILRDGAIYVRPRRKPETSEVANQTDMRDLLDLATDKRLRQWLGTASRAGATIVSADQPHRQEQQGAAEAFLSELPDDFR